MAAGYALASAGHDTRAIQAWMGHKNIQHTVRYKGLDDRFHEPDHGTGDLLVDSSFAVR